MSHRQHGTRAKYVIDRCRCDDCREANRVAQIEHRRRIEPPYVDARPAREHIEYLRANGVGLKTVAKASGVPHGALSKLVYGTSTTAPSKRIRRATLDKILAVTPADCADSAKVPAGPTWELLGEMITAGVPKGEIARQLGAQQPALQISRDLVRGSTVRAVAELHRRWTSGELVIHRRDRWGNETPVLPPAPDPGRARTAQARRDVETGRLLDLVEHAQRRRSEQADWRRSAACRGRATWMWFPSPGDRATERAAKQICGACIVRRQCLDANVAEPDGIYGGLSPAERRTLTATGEVSCG